MYYLPIFNIFFVTLQLYFFIKVINPQFLILNSQLNYELAS